LITNQLARMELERSPQVKPNMIGVILGGVPSPRVLEVAKSLKARGMHILAAIGEPEKGNKTIKLDDLEVPLFPSSEGAATENSLKELIKEKYPSKQGNRKNQNQVVAVDVGDKLNSALFAKLDIPVVVGTKGVEQMSKTRSFYGDERLALIEENYDQQLRAFEDMFGTWAWRFPRLFTPSWNLSGYEVMPPSFGDEFSLSTRSMMDNLNRLFERDIDETRVKRVRGQESGPNEAGVQPEYLEGRVVNQFKIENGQGQSSYTFRSEIKGDENYAEGVADSVQFLAQKSAEVDLNITRPRRFNLLDVMQTPLLSL